MHILALPLRRELKRGPANSPLNYTSKGMFFLSPEGQILF